MDKIKRLFFDILHVMVSIALLYAIFVAFNQHGSLYNNAGWVVYETTTEHGNMWVHDRDNALAEVQSMLNMRTKAGEPIPIIISCRPID